MNGPINVAHIANGDGKCRRCGAGLGCFGEVSDVTNEYHERPWRLDERVIEYECADGRTRFADLVTGYTQDCIP